MFGTKQSWGLRLILLKLDFDGKRPFVEYSLLWLILLRSVGIFEYQLALKTLSQRVYESKRWWQLQNKIASKIQLCLTISVTPPHMLIYLSVAYFLLALSRYTTSKQLRPTPYNRALIKRPFGKDRRGGVGLLSLRAIIFMFLPLRQQLLRRRQHIRAEGHGEQLAHRLDLVLAVPRMHENRGIELPSRSPLAHQPNTNIANSCSSHITHLQELPQELPTHATWTAVLVGQVRCYAYGLYIAAAVTKGRDGGADGDALRAGAHWICGVFDIGAEDYLRGGGGGRGGRWVDEDGGADAELRVGACGGAVSEDSLRMHAKPRGSIMK